MKKDGYGKGNWGSYKDQLYKKKGEEVDPITGEEYPTPTAGKEEGE